MHRLHIGRTLTRVHSCISGVVLDDIENHSASIEVRVALAVSNETFAIISASGSPQWRLRVVYFRTNTSRAILRIDRIKNCIEEETLRKSKVRKREGFLAESIQKNTVHYEPVLLLGN